MKIPKTFIPEKNTEKSLEKILSKKLYTIDEEKSKILVHDFNGGVIGSKTIGENIDDLETFSFYNNKMLTVKFGDNLYNRAVFNKRMEPIIMTPSYPNQAYSVFERKNGPDLLMVNTTAQRTKGTKISYYETNGTKLNDFYYEIPDTLTNKAFVVKTKKENYLALCFNYHTILVNESLHRVLTLKTEPDINDIQVVDTKDGERILSLCCRDVGLAYQALKILDSKLNLLEQLNTKNFKPTTPDDPWHDKAKSLKTHKLNSQEYLFFSVENKIKNRTDLKVLNTDFEEVFQLEGIIQYRFNVEKFNGKDHLFVRLKKGEVVNVHDENFNLEDEIPVAYSSLQGKYKILELNGTSYFACVNEGYLTLHSGKIPFYGSHWTNKKVASADIKLRNIDGLKKIIPFEYKGKDFLALEYEKNRGIDVYDENFKFVRSFPGGDFCVA